MSGAVRHSDEKAHAFWERVAEFVFKTAERSAVVGALLFASERLPATRDNLLVDLAFYTALVLLFLTTMNKMSEAAMVVAAMKFKSWWPRRVFHPLAVILASGFCTLVAYTALEVVKAVAETAAKS